MKLIKNPLGKININATLSTLGVGETLKLNESDVKPEYVRSRASIIARRNGWTLEVNNSRALNGRVIVRRTR